MHGPFATIQYPGLAKIVSPYNFEIDFFFLPALFMVVLVKQMYLCVTHLSQPLQYY